MATAAMLIARRAAQTHAFDPRNIAGLFSWFAATSLGLSDGAAVSSWPDQSINGNTVAQATGAAKPIFRTQIWNGKPGVLFSGAQSLDLTGTVGRPTGDVTVFVVASTFKQGLFPNMVSHGNGSVNTGYQVYWTTGVEYGPTFFPVDASGGEVATDSSTAALAQRANPCLYTGIRSGSTATIRTDRGVSSASASGSGGILDYGGGDTLSLGHNGAGSRFHVGYLHEVIVYARALSSTERDEVENYLDIRWKLTRAQSAWFAWFNGASSPPAYQIGHAWSPDGKAFKRYLSNPVLSSGAAWETGAVKDPYVIWDGAQFVMFYAGGPVAGIGRATSPDGFTWTKDVAHNPVFVPGGGHAWFPVIYHDASAPAGHQYRMWYANGDGSSGTNVGFAHSADGVTWTDVGTVLPIGSTGQWDAQIVYPCTVWFDGTTWTLYYGGRDVANSRDQGGQATFTDPTMGPYTRSGINPTIPDRPTAAQSLTLDMAPGNRVVHLASTALFSTRMPVFIFSGDTTSEQNRVLSIDSGTQLTLELPVINSRTTGNNAGIAAFDHWNTLPNKGIFQLGDGTFRLYSGWYSPCLGTAGLNENREACGVSTAATAAGPWTFDIVSGASGGAFMLVDPSEWDTVSAENICVIPHPVGV